jgi:hypothetical protein
MIAVCKSSENIRATFDMPADLADRLDRVRRDACVPPASRSAYLRLALAERVERDERKLARRGNAQKSETGCSCVREALA